MSRDYSYLETNRRSNGQFGSGAGGNGPAPLPDYMGDRQLVPDDWQPRSYGELEQRMAETQDALVEVSDYNRLNCLIPPDWTCMQVRDHGDCLTDEQFNELLPSDLAKARYKAWCNQSDEYDPPRQRQMLEAWNDPEKLNTLSEYNELWADDTTQWGCYDTTCPWGTEDGDYQNRIDILADKARNSTNQAELDQLASHWNPDIREAVSANPNISLETMDHLSSDINDMVREKLWDNPVRAKHMAAIEKDADELVNYKGRITKKMLIDRKYTPQDAKALDLARQAKRGKLAGVDFMREEGKEFNSDYLSDTTFAFLCRAHAVNRISTRNDLDGERTRLLVSNMDRREVMILASNRNLHGKAWNQIEQHASGQAYEELAENPSYPNAEKLARNWYRETKAKRDEYGDGYVLHGAMPRLGQLLSQRNDITPETRKQLDEANGWWRDYAKQSNAYNKRHGVQIVPLDPEHAPSAGLY